MSRGRLITIGSFDGVHRGHQALLDRTVMEARKRGLRSMALTFHVPPRMVLDSHVRRLILSTETEKRFLLGRSGMDEVEVFRFGPKLAATRPFGFFRDTLLNAFHARGVVVGSDFRFGADRSAGAVELVRWGEDFGIPVWVISPVKRSREVVSSTAIRSLLDEGRFVKASALLGHPYLIAGKVVRGRGMGSKLGFPTANVETPDDKVLPRGVFAIRGWAAGRANRVGGVWNGVCNIGVRPTFGGTHPSVEAHFPGRRVDLRGKTLFVELVRRIRGEKKFPSVDALRRQIARDVAAARADRER